MREEKTSRPATLKEWWLQNRPESHKPQEAQEQEIPRNTLVETAPPEHIPMYLDQEK